VDRVRSIWPYVLRQERLDLASHSFVAGVLGDPHDWTSAA
jgi:hypothetical protein